MTVTQLRIYLMEQEAVGNSSMPIRIVILDTSLEYHTALATEVEVDKTEQEVVIQ
jgi:hypothetical protein